jgi:prepilin-type N-terminal cleavage/methylation domain-containing protein
VEPNLKKIKRDKKRVGGFVNKMHRREKGFTLIELLVVVAILGIIAAVVIPNISGFMVTGQLSAANSEAEQVKTGALGYFGEYGMWPATSDDLVPDYISGTIKAVYYIDDEFGWLLSANATPTGWTPLIMFDPGLTGDNGYHGRWERAS